MIMDIAQHLRGTDVKMATILESNMVTEKNKTRESSSPSATSVSVSKKRSFDVAFLMQPDEKLRPKVEQYHPGHAKKTFVHSMAHPEPNNNIAVKADALLRQMGSPQSSLVDDTSSVDRNSNESPTNEEIDIMTNGHSNSSLESSTAIDTACIQESVRYFRSQVHRSIQNHPSARVFGAHSPSLNDLEVHRSAFTKVPHIRLETPPPVPPLSPDRLSCSSISPPAVSGTPPRPFSGFRSMAPADYGFPAQMPPVTHPYQGHPGLATPPSSEGKQPQFFYRPPSQEQLRSLAEIPANGYPPLPTTSPPQLHPFPHELARHPAAAAALLSTLIPPTISSAFSLAAQNVCAKCNISFRMTSDLVYHMRSHHKSENVTESYRRKREDKLKCPVCNESFRERHHLTRHMTAHQDKASDDVEPPQHSARNNHQLMARASGLVHGGNKGH